MIFPNLGGPHKLIFAAMSSAAAENRHWGGCKKRQIAIEFVRIQGCMGPFSTIDWILILLKSDFEMAPTIELFVK